MTIFISRHLASRPGVELAPKIRPTPAPAPAPPPPPPPPPAAPTLIFGETLVPLDGVNGLALTKRNEFLALVTNPAVFTFEAETPGEKSTFTRSFPAPQSDKSLTFTSTGPMTVIQGDPEEPAGTGRFNTTPSGEKWIEFRDTLTIDFPVHVNAFGFYGTDFGDFNGQVSVTFTDSADIESTFILPHALPSPNGALIFWGFVNPLNTYKRMRLFCTYVGGPPPDFDRDYFGVDDVIIGAANP